MELPPAVAGEFQVNDVLVVQVAGFQTAGLKILLKYKVLNAFVRYYKMNKFFY